MYEYLCTSRYLFLLQDPDHQIDLNKYVLNTEAHPFPICPACAGGVDAEADLAAATKAQHGAGAPIRWSPSRSPH